MGFFPLRQIVLLERNLEKYEGEKEKIREKRKKDR